MSKKFSHITPESVCAAMEEYDRRGRAYMFKTYKSKPSTKWYVYYKRGVYDQKLIIRAAHAHTKKEGCLHFKAKESRKYLKKHLKFVIVTLRAELPDSKLIPRG